MASIADVAQALWKVLHTVAEEAAQTSGFVRRRRKLTGARFVQTLVLGWLRTPVASLGELVQTAGSLGIPITEQGLAKRFTPEAAACLRTVLDAAVGEVLSADPVAIPLLERFPVVAVQDSTTVGLPEEMTRVWPGCGGRTGTGPAALKLHVRLDLAQGTLTGPLLTAGRTQDRRSPLQTWAAAPLPPGSLRLADLGFFSLENLRELSAHNVFWLSRLQVQTAVFDARGRRRDLARWLKATGAAGTWPVDQPVSLGVTHRLPARLVAVPVPQEVVDARRRKLRAEARKRQQPLSQARLALVGWTIFVTTLPTEQVSVAEILVLARARWQIEWLFKLWKQYGRLAESRSQQPWRVLCEVYAKLIGLIIQHWCVLISCWAVPDRSLVKATQTVRASAPLLACALAGRIDLAVALDQIVRCVAGGCRLTRRRQAPSTYQLLLDPPALPDFPASHEFPAVA
jgi:hypothetical protein